MNAGGRLDEDELTRRRLALVRNLRRAEVIRSDAVAAAMEAVPRHRFVPGAQVAAAYVDEPVLLKRSPAGHVISTVSQPAMVGLMLEELDVAPGHQVLEVGTASGYNAALLAHLVGETGLVVTVELEQDLAATAAGTLSELGVTNVVVRTGDGSVGAEDPAAFDRIIVTAGAAEISPAWVQQLSEGGRLVVPITNPSGNGVCRTYSCQAGGLTVIHEIPCGFVPLRH